MKHLRHLKRPENKAAPLKPENICVTLRTIKCYITKQKGAFEDVEMLNAYSVLHVRSACSPTGVRSDKNRQIRRTQL